MMTINLLPRKPWVDRNFFSLLIIIIVFFAVCCLYLIVWSHANHLKIAAERQQIALLNKVIAHSTAALVPDTQSKVYKQFAAQIDQLKPTRRDWIPVFDLLSGGLLKDSHITTMIAKDQANITLKVQFSTIEEAADYEIQLERSALVAKVLISSITLVEAPALKPSPTAIPTPTLAIPFTNTVPKVSQSPQAESTFQGDQLLNQLNKLIAQRTAATQKPQKSTAPSLILPNLGKTQAGTLNRHYDVAMSVVLQDLAQGKQGAQ